LKIYTKTALIISTALVGLILLFFIISATIVLGGFTEIEEQDASENMERLVYALADDINTLNAVTKEWANR
jgi:sensor domain CHASE-containing protein